MKIFPRPTRGPCSRVSHLYPVVGVVVEPLVVIVELRFQARLEAYGLDIAQVSRAGQSSMGTEKGEAVVVVARRQRPGHPPALPPTLSHAFPASQPPPLHPTAVPCPLP